MRQLLLGSVGCEPPVTGSRGVDDAESSGRGSVSQVWMFSNVAAFGQDGRGLESLGDAGRSRLSVVHVQITLSAKLGAFHTRRAHA